jgi:hypothetical protein
MILRVADQIGAGQFKQRSRWLWATLLHMDEGTRQLDQTLVKFPIALLPLDQPQLFEYFMGVIKQSLVETMEVSKVVGIQSLAAEPVE